MIADIGDKSLPCGSMVFLPLDLLSNCMTQHLMDSALGSASTPVSMDAIRVIEGPCRAGCVIDEGMVWTKPSR